MRLEFVRSLFARIFPSSKPEKACNLLASGRSRVRRNSILHFRRAWVFTIFSGLLPVASFGASISYLQVASSTPQSPTAIVSVPYGTAQTAGDMNIVVGWNDTAATVQSVTDSLGNGYRLAVGPTSGSALGQSI